MRFSFYSRIYWSAQLFLLFTLFCLLSACTPTPPVSSPASLTVAPPPSLPVTTVSDTPAASATPAGIQTPTINEEFTHTYGITITVKSLCSDGVKTTLTLLTDINARLWQLPRSDFFPQGNTYFETRIVLFENGIPFGSIMSGFRDEPKHNLLTGSVSTSQVFEFQQAPLPGSVFNLTAEVSLLELPRTYTPPPPLVQVEQGYIEIPMKYEVPVQLGLCP